MPIPCKCSLLVASGYNKCTEKDQNCPIISGTLLTPHTFQAASGCGWMQLSYFKNVPTQLSEVADCWAVISSCGTAQHSHTLTVACLRGTREKWAVNGFSLLMLLCLLTPWCLSDGALHPNTRCSCFSLFLSNFCALLFNACYVLFAHVVQAQSFTALARTTNSRFSSFS